MTTTLTYKEVKMLCAFIQEGAEVNGADCAEDLINDNMTYMTAAELRKVLKWKKEVVAGVMSSLEKKGMIADTGETMVEGTSSAKEGYTDWVATDAGITTGWAFAFEGAEFPKPGKEVHFVADKKPTAKTELKWVKTSRKTWEYGDVTVSFADRKSPYVAELNGKKIAEEYWFKDLKAAVEAKVGA